MEISVLRNPTKLKDLPIGSVFIFFADSENRAHMKTDEIQNGFIKCIELKSGKLTIGAINEAAVIELHLPPISVTA